MENVNGTGKIIGALIVGALVGAAVGVLFAPEKGNKTRNKIVSGSKDFAEDLKKKMNDEVEALVSKVGELESLAESKVNEILSSVKRNAEALTHHN